MQSYLQSKVQTISGKNVYGEYLMSAEPRSSSEKKFEKFCESCSAVDWIYKNGDKGDEYFSIVYLDNANHQKLFYPDYIVSVKGEVWIIETKGGFDKTGASEDIDIYCTFAPPDLWARNRETGKSQAATFAENGVVLYRADNNRKQGWYALKELLKVREDGKPGIIIHRGKIQKKEMEKLRHSAEVLKETIASAGI